MYAAKRASEVGAVGRMVRTLSDGNGGILTKLGDTFACISSDPAEVVAFLARGGTTGGFSISYAVNPATGEVVELFKKGKPVQRDVKPLLAAGYTEWHFDWAFAGKNWKVNGADATSFRVLDFTKWKDIAPWARAFGYVA